MKNILIAGGSGLIGTSISDYLHSKDYSISWLSRDPKNKPYPCYYWDPAIQEMDIQALERVDVFINLAGSSIGDGRWTETRKKDILQSRLDAIQTLKLHLAKHNHKIPLLIQASAMGYYGNRPAEVLTENSNAANNDFLSRTTVLWEQASNSLDSFFVNKSILRTGLYLHPQAGVWPKLIQTLPFHIVNYFGKGQQLYSWIHYMDFNRIIEWIIEHPISGIFNVTAPQAISNKDLATRICALAHNNCITFSIPEFLLQWILGEQSRLLLNSSNVYPAHILKHKFAFQYETADQAIKDLLGH